METASVVAVSESDVAALIIFHEIMEELICVDEKFACCTFTNPHSRFRNILLEYLYELLNTDKGKKIAIGFLCHLQAHRNCTLLVGWFVYLLGVREMMEQKK